MGSIHNLTILPEQQVINSVAELRREFNSDSFHLPVFLTKLKETIIESEFISSQNNGDWMSNWMSKRGPDFLANPKLFACAPLTYICVFLREIFHNFEVKEIQEQIPQKVIEHALARLDDFKSF